MEIKNVTFGSYSLGANKGNIERGEEQKEAPQVAVAGEKEDLKSEAVLDAMSIVGAQNKALITQTERKEINPADYLDQDRISDIEAMMGKFEDGVNVVADTIEKEFPGFFAEDTKNALAAKIYAQG